MAQGRFNRDYLGVRLGVHQAREAVASIAADAGTRVRMRLVQHDAERRVKWRDARSRKVVAQLLQPWLVTDRGIWVRRAGGRFGRILTPLPMNTIEPLR